MAQMHLATADDFAKRYQVQDRKRRRALQQRLQEQAAEAAEAVEAAEAAEAAGSAGSAVGEAPPPPLPPPPQQQQQQMRDSAAALLGRALDHYDQALIQTQGASDAAEGLEQEEAAALSPFEGEGAALLQLEPLVLVHQAWLLQDHCQWGPLAGTLHNLHASLRRALKAGAAASRASDASAPSERAAAAGGGAEGGAAAGGGGQGQGLCHLLLPTFHLPAAAVRSLCAASAQVSVL
jgi:hypothetical protein